MDTMIYAVINGKVRPMHYSLEVMFAVHEKFGSLEAALELLEHDDRESFNAVRFMTTAMVNDAELCLRAEGYDHSPMMKEEDLGLRIKPFSYLALKKAISDTITMGYKQEQENKNKETDLGLLELQKKEEAGN